jgi:ATP-dependent Clp protease ATP-binding subunit ClpC
MRLDLSMYVAQPKKGLYEVSIPWLSALSSPIRGPNRTALMEELMFRVLDMVEGNLEPSELDRLMPPSEIYLTACYLEFEHPASAGAVQSVTTHVIVGEWLHDGIVRAWLPRVPGVCVAMPEAEDLYPALNAWLSEWVADEEIETLGILDAPFPATIETIEAEFDFDRVSASTDPAKKPQRMIRPEVLAQAATNLSQHAGDQHLQISFGREDLVDELVEILMSPESHQICLIGPSGVGKTALMQEASRRAWSLAKRYQSRHDVWQTTGDRLIAGMSIIGQWERRMENLCDELSARSDVLYVDGLYGLIRAGQTGQGSSNVARFIEPYLEQGRFSMIVEATEETFALARTQAPGFVDKFRRIQVPELNYKATLTVATELIRDLESEHSVRFTADAVEAILQLSRRFFRTDAFPGKATRLVKQCLYEALRIQVEVGPGVGVDLPSVRIDPEVVARVVGKQTGLPMSILRPGTGRTTAEIRSAFESRIFSQDQVVESVSGLVSAIESGMTDPECPLGSFLFIGPSGVGKTETAKALARDLFGSDDRLIRLDMSELSGPGAPSRMIGTLQEPEGELTSRVRVQPFCVVLFDEIEKAHSLVLNLLLQVLSDGRLTDAAGRTVDFRNAVIIMTSNLGAASEDRWLGFADADTANRATHYRRAAEEFFRPEFFNRIDHILAFQPLDAIALRKIARRTLENMLDRRGVREADVLIDVSEDLVNHLATTSLDRRYGARTLAHRIERTLMTPLAFELTRHDSSVGLTRVVIKPTESGVDLKLQSLQVATPLKKDARSHTEPSEEEARRELEEVVARIDAFAKSEIFRALRKDYDGILNELNLVADQGGGWSGQLAERLHQREGCLEHMAGLTRRIYGLKTTQDGLPRVVNARDERKSNAHHWRKIAGELREELFWLHRRVDDMLHGAGVSPLLFVSGVSGPFSNALVRWLRRFQAFSQMMAFDLAFSVRVADRWSAFREGIDLSDLRAIVVMGDRPGTRRIFDAFRGYCWTPQPSSQGLHTLLRFDVFDGVDGLAGLAHDGPRELDSLVESLNEESMPIDSSQHLIEFKEESGQLSDLRMDRSWSIPDDASPMLGSLVKRVIMDRQSADLIFRGGT